jgi:hypothetical protein
VRDGQKVVVDFDASSGALNFQSAPIEAQERAAAAD